MKQTILPISFLFLLFLTTFSTQAQVTITESNFPRLASFTDSVIRAVPTGIALPAEGSDQIWDYTSLAEEEFVTKVHFDANGNAGFSGALNYYEDNLSFQGFPISNNTYEALDANGWYDMGREISDVIYSIAAISGGSNDSLRFTGGSEVFDGRIDLIQFPMTYQDQWTQSRVEITNFELTIAAFGLNQTPGLRQRTITQNREVVGYGQLTIPAYDGTPTPSMEVLLLKIERSAVDSFFLGGAPAPTALLDAFGLSQGSITSDDFYVFYKPGFGGPVLNINLSGNNQVSTAFYRPQAAEVSTAVSEVYQIELKHFPNPIFSGQPITIQTETPTSAGQVSFFDASGRIIRQMAYESASGYHFRVQIPSSFQTGWYMYRVDDQSGTPMGSGKLIIN